jgi:hypothetical protein
MGVFNNNYVKGFIFLTIIFPLVSNCSRDCKKFKKNVSVCKKLTACSLLVGNNATISGDLTVNGGINVGGGGPVGAQYAYVYTPTTIPAIVAGATVPFNFNGPISSGIIHSTVTNADQVTVLKAGTYAITWFVSVPESNPVLVIRFEIYVNGASLSAQSSSYTQADDGGQDIGQCILSLAANDVITLVNTGANHPLAGGFVGASIIIRKIA